MYMYSLYIFLGGELIIGKVFVSEMWQGLFSKGLVCGIC